MIESVGNSTIRQSLFTLPTKQGPSAIDYVTVVDGEFWATKGIYKIEGDVLTISESARDADRPKDFRRWDSALDELVLVRSFQRVKSTDKNDPSSGSQNSGENANSGEPR